MKTSREVWAKRVRRWRDSDLTAAEFASEIGVNARTLSYWKWRLGKEGSDVPTKRKGRPRSSAQRPRTTEKFVEITPSPSIGDRIELVIDAGVVVRVPDGFEAETLRRVLQAVSSKGEA